MSAFDEQVGGSHYKQYAIQPYEFFFKNKITHEKAAIIRRILRYDHSTGKGLEDLLKIKHEVDLIIELQGYNNERQTVRPNNDNKKAVQPDRKGTPPEGGRSENFVPGVFPR